MHNQRISLIISSVVGIIATFLPFMKSWFNSVSLIKTSDGTGYIVIIAFAISLIVTLLGNHRKAMIKGHLAGVIIPGVIPGALLLLFLLNRINDNLANLLTSFEIGFYLVLLASLSILILGLTLKVNVPSEISKIEVSDIFCTKCGKKYSSTLAGEYCEECGNKL